VAKGVFATVKRGKKNENKKKKNKNQKHQQKPPQKRRRERKFDVRGPRLTITDNEANGKKPQIEFW